MSDIEQRIRERAYRLWLEEGCLERRADDHWDMATELVAIENRQQTTLKPILQNLGPVGEPIEPIEALRNAGEFPTLLTKARVRIPRGDPKSAVGGPEGRPVRSLGQLA